MEIFRIKHKGTGLYYKPANGGSNLSETGKIYSRKMTMPTWVTCNIYSNTGRLSSLAKKMVDYFRIELNWKGSWINEKYKFKSEESDWEIEYIK